MREALLSAVVTSPGTAERTMVESLRRGVVGDASVQMVLGALLVILAATAVVLLIRRFLNQAPRRQRPEPVDYVTLAVDVMRLTETDRHDLLTVVERARPRVPGAMLLSPANLSHAVRQALAAQPDEHLRQRLDDLSVRLYGTPLR
jgi:hypothetical protein